MRIMVAIAVSFFALRHLSTAEGYVNRQESLPGAFLCDVVAPYQAGESHNRTCRQLSVRAGQESVFE